MLTELLDRPQRPVTPTEADRVQPAQCERGCACRRKQACERQPDLASSLDCAGPLEQLPSEQLCAGRARVGECEVREIERSPRELLPLAVHKGSEVQLLAAGEPSEAAAADIDRLHGQVVQGVGGGEGGVAQVAHEICVLVHVCSLIGRVGVTFGIYSRSI